jgi:hypothetical protein
MRSGVPGSASESVVPGTRRPTVLLLPSPVNRACIRVNQGTVKLYH